MYTIISSTNRPGSNTLKVAQHYQKLYAAAGVEASILSLMDINPLTSSDAVKHAEQNILMPTTKFIFIVPEYNGSFPGVLKVLIDSLPRTVWTDKKASLTGVALGRAGNIRGLDHLTNIFHYLGVAVLPQQLYLSQIDKLMNESGEIIDAATLQNIHNQIQHFIKF